MASSKITTCLWLDGTAEDAANFYVSIFKEAKITTTQRYTSSGQEHHGKEPGSVMTVSFELNGHPFVGLNGGPMFKLSPAIGFQIKCDDQDEVDYYWDKLCEGGKPSRCGM